MKSGLLLLLLAIAFNVLCQSVPTINAERPRLEISKERFDWLKANTSGGDSGETYNRLRSSYDSNWLTNSKVYMVGSDSTQWNYEWGSSTANQMSSLTSFFLQLGNDPLALKRCEFIISRYIEYLDGINFDNYSGDTRENLLRNNCDYGGLLFDWTYDHVPQNLRQRFAQSLYRVLEYYMNVYLLTGSGNSYVSSHNIYNCILSMRAVLALHGADGLSSSQMSKVNSWYQTLVGKWEDGILPAFAHFRDDDGGWNWGAGYAMINLERQYQFFDDMLVGTNKNYYQDQAWIKESINQYWYFLRPNNVTIHLGDAAIELNNADRVMYRHAAEFEDPRSQYLVQVYNQSQYLHNTTIIFHKLIFKDFTASYLPHPQPPLSWWADKTGLAVNRTSWDEDATMVWFYCAPAKRADHEHRDNNSFVVYKDKPLIIDAGYYDAFATSHFNNYYTRTIAHNSICVFDGSESYRNLGRNVSNDGGQIESDRLENIDDVFSTKHKRGEWIRFTSGEDYAYHVADAAASYNSSKLDRFERRLLYHKPDRLIVLDHLHLLGIENQERKAKYINHFVNRPEINGKIVDTEVANRIVTYDGRDYKTTNGKGSVAIRTLLPEETTTTLIGGDGYEYWVNGTNYPPNANINYEKHHPGAWRIEVEPEQVVENQLFLHTIKIADDKTPANAGGKVFTSESTIAVDWENHLYMFSADGQLEMDEYEANAVEGSRTVKVFALDLKENTSFGVFVNDELKRVGESTADGVFEITVELGSGTQNVLVKDTIAGDPNPGTDPEPDPDDPDDDEASGKVKVYPNPSSGTFTIRIEDDTVSEFELDVFDSNGRKVTAVKVNSNTSNMDLSGLSAGVYFLLIHYLDKSVKRKIVLAD
jgi:hypothetical protein